MEDVTTGSGATPYDVVWNGGGVRPDGIRMDPGRGPFMNPGKDTPPRWCGCGSIDFQLVFIDVEWIFHELLYDAPPPGSGLACAQFLDFYSVFKRNAIQTLIGRYRAQMVGHALIDGNTVKVN